MSALADNPPAGQAQDGASGVSPEMSIMSTQSVNGINELGESSRFVRLARSLTGRVMALLGRGGARRPGVGYAVNRGAAGTVAQLPENFPGPSAAVVPGALAPPYDAQSMFMRQAVQHCISHAQHTERLKLLPHREAKVNAIIDRQEVLLRCVAMLVDEALVARCGVRELQFQAQVVRDNWRAPDGGVVKLS